MSACGAENGGQLIPGLSEDLVLSRVVSRLPWHTRPLCRAVSKSWRTVLDTKNAELDLQTRLIQVPLLRGLFLFYTFDKHIFIRDDDIHEPCRINGYQIQPHWRKLPPLTGLDDTIFVEVVARSGMVYVWSLDSQLDRDDTMCGLKLDMGCADWTWKKLPVPCAFDFGAVSFNDKIYVPDNSWQNALPPSNVTFVHDMTTIRCRQVETWNQGNFIVVSDGCVEEMYSVTVLNGNGELEVLIYDGQSDSWKPRERVLISELPFLGASQLLNNDCFEPASETGINIVWWCGYEKSLHWFNSSAGRFWVDIRCIPVLEGRHMEIVLFERGSMYGIVCDKQEQKKDTWKDEEGGSLSGLFKRTLMKGRINVESSSVVWEEVLEMGFFQASQYFDPVVDLPIRHFIAMA